METTTILLSLTILILIIILLFISKLINRLNQIEKSINLEIEGVKEQIRILRTQFNKFGTDSVEAQRIIIFILRYQKLIGSNSKPDYVSSGEWNKVNEYINEIIEKVKFMFVPF